MDISSGSAYPANALSNFAPHPFVVDGVECASMEGFLQSLKFKTEEMQREICKLVGRKAKFRGKKKNWKRSQILYWKREEINRHSQEYQDLLDRAYAALGENSGFRRALLASGDAVLTHSMGKTSSRETVLTQAEFCSRLRKLRAEFRRERRI